MTGLFFLVKGVTFLYQTALTSQTLKATDKSGFSDALKRRRLSGQTLKASSWLSVYLLDSFNARDDINVPRIKTAILTL